MISSLSVFIVFSSRFHLPLSEELAEQKIEHLIDESVNAKITKLTDMVHDVHQLIIN